jgi:thiol:disulfide interchange protein DsbD
MCEKTPKNKYMKKIALTLSFICFVFAMSFAQVVNPVQWSFSAKKIANKTYELHMTATVSGDWHIYAQDAGEGPEPTSFSFLKNPLLTLNGKVKEIGRLEKQFDPNFNSELKFYSHKVDFVQTIKLRTAVATIAKGTVTFMVCNNQKCLPPKDIPFSIKIDGK